MRRFRVSCTSMTTGRMGSLFPATAEAGLWLPSGSVNCNSHLTNLRQRNARSAGGKHTHPASLGALVLFGADSEAKSAALEGQPEAACREAACRETPLRVGAGRVRVPVTCAASLSIGPGWE